MTKKQKKNNWIRRFMLGGIGVLGGLSPYSDATSNGPTPSSSVQLWISDSRRKDGVKGYSISELVRQPSAPIHYAAHRSHRSHASHYSSQGGHQSHYSSYNSSEGSQRTPVKTPPPKDETPPKESVTPKTTTPVVKKEAEPVNEKQSGKVIAEAKVGVVKTVVSPTVMILEDSTVVRLAGVKKQTQEDEKAEHEVAVKTRVEVEEMVKGKTVRVATLYNKNSYVFVFPNELECYCLNLELVKEGKLVVDSESAVYGLPVLIKAQNDAQSKGVGVWEKKEKK